MSNYEVINKQEVETKIEVTANIESIIEELLKEIGLKANWRELIRAVVNVSEGSNYFEASYKELAVFIHGQKILNDKAQANRKSENVKYHLDNLIRWQEANGLEIIRIVTLGNRVHMTNGIFAYNKTRFHFILLDEITKLSASNEDTGFEVSINKIVEKLKEKYQPIERRKTYHPNHQIQKAGKTLLTKFEKIFRLNIEAKSDPVRSCERFLKQLNERLEELSTEWKEQQARNSFIEDFEKLMAGCDEAMEFTGCYNEERGLPLDS